MIISRASEAYIMICVHLASVFVACLGTGGHVGAGCLAALGGATFSIRVAPVQEIGRHLKIYRQIYQIYLIDHVDWTARVPLFMQASHGNNYFR